MRTIDQRVLVVFLVSLPLGLADGADSVPWVADLATAHQMAAETNKLVLIHFKGENCSPCLRVEKNVFSVPVFGYSVGQNFIPVRINATASPDIARRFGVTSWPTDVILTAEGRELHRMISPRDSQAYIRTLGQIAWRFKNSSGQQGNMGGYLGAGTGAGAKRPASGMAQAARAHAAQTMAQANHERAPNSGVAQSPSQSQFPYAIDQSPFAAGGTARTAGGTQLSPSPFASRSRARTGGRANRGSPFGGQPSVASPGSPGSTASTASLDSPSTASFVPSGADSSLRTKPPSTATSSAASSPRASRSAMIKNLFVDSAPRASALPSQSATPTMIRSESARKPSARPKLAEAAIPATTTPQSHRAAVNDSSENSHQLVNAQMPSPRAISPKYPTTAPTSDTDGLLMDGFCCVTLMDENKWTPGDARWGARHRGQVYLFQTAANQQKFLANPDKYSPMLAGYDPVVYRESGTFRSGSRSHGVRYRNKMYLFASEDSLQQFWTAPQQYAESAGQAMQQANTIR